MDRVVSAIAIVPARGGSKGLPRKNARPLLGHPLVAWSIAAGAAGARGRARDRVDGRRGAARDRAALRRRGAVPAPGRAGPRHDAGPSGVRARAALARAARGRVPRAGGAAPADLAAASARAGGPRRACAARGYERSTRCARSCPPRRIPTRPGASRATGCARSSRRPAAWPSRTTSRGRCCPATFWQTGHLDVVRRATVTRGCVAHRLAGAAAPGRPRLRGRHRRGRAVGAGGAAARRQIASLRPSGRRRARGQPGRPSAWSSSTSTACSPTTASTVAADGPRVGRLQPRGRRGPGRRCARPASRWRCCRPRRAASWPRAAGSSVCRSCRACPTRDPRSRALCAEHGFRPSEVAYVGNDVADLPCLERAGLAVAVADAVRRGATSGATSCSRAAAATVPSARRAMRCWRRSAAMQRRRHGRDRDRPACRRRRTSRLRRGRDRHQPQRRPGAREAADRRRPRAPAATP